MLLIASLGPAFALDLTLSGTCPGVVRFDVAVEPGASIGLLSAASEGDTPLAAGPCAGAPVGLGLEGLKLRARATDDDRDGTITLTPAVPAPGCGLFVQVVDVAACDVSAVLRVPEIAPVDAVMFAASSSGASGLWAIDPAAGTAVRVADPGRPLTGLAFDNIGTLYAIDGGGNSAVSNPNFGVVSILDTTTGSLTPIAETGLRETALEWADGLLYAVDERTAYLSIDPDTGATAELGARPEGEGYGYALAHDGHTMWRVNDQALYTLDAYGVPTFVAPVRGTAGGWGGGATFHEGHLWIAVDNGRGGTDLLVVDTATGATTPTGIRIPDDTIDALASRTP